MLSVTQSSFSQTAQRHELWKLQECILGVRHSEQAEVLGGLLTNGDRGTMTCFPTSPAPPKTPLGVGLHVLPGAPPCPAPLGEAAASRAQGTPRHPWEPALPTAAVCYLTTDTGIQREPPSDPHPESRHPRPGARCSTAGGSRAAERPGCAEVE